MCAVLRGDVHSIRVGRRTNIQDGTIVHVMTGTHATRIGDHVTIGHGAIVHGCTIDDQCLIGMGAILLNGAQVGSGSIVAAGTLLVEGMKVPPKSLVMGSPGKVKRLLTQAEVADNLAYAARYVGYRLSTCRSVDESLVRMGRVGVTGAGMDISVSTRRGWGPAASGKR